LSVFCLTPTLRLDRVSPGKIFWTTENSSSLKDNTVSFSRPEFDSNGEVHVEIGDGQSAIKDIRIEVYGSTEKPFASISIEKDSGIEILKTTF
jgi:hypothetical protein